MQFKDVDFSQVLIGPLQSGKGCKTCNASLRSAPVRFLLSSSEWFAAPFGASAYQDPKATRLNMELDVSGKEVLPLLQAMDQWVVQYVIKTGIFEDMSAEDIAKQHHSCLQYNDEYNAYRLRTKLNTEGMGACKWFSAGSREPVQFPSLVLRESVVQPVLWFKGLWKQNSQWGMSLDVIKCLVDSQGQDVWDY